MKQPRITFSTSLRQNKEVSVRRARLFIAMPVPFDVKAPADPYELARILLPSVPGHDDPKKFIYAAHYDDLPVFPPKPGPRGAGTEGIFGRIMLNEDELDGCWPVALMRCVVCELRPLDDVDGRIVHTDQWASTIPTKWAGVTYCDGHRIKPEDFPAS
jgi:hypothetical protein